MAESKIKVLIADDDPFVREMLAVILEAGGYEVQTAEDGRDALSKHASAPDTGLIISDMNMPGMSGLELIKELRSGESDTPVIILTGNNEISVAVEAINSGANDYLLKDENIQDTVLISVGKALEKHMLKKQNIQLMADLARENERLESEKALAQKVQKNILPRNIAIEGFEVGSLYRPSDKIGGDFFDAWEAGGGVHFLIGDVSGHSTSSALIMAVCKGMLQSLGFSINDPAKIVKTANGMLCEILSDSGMFLSLVYGVYEADKGTMNIVSAGHNPVFLVEGGSVKAIEPTGPVMGWDSDDTWETLNVPFNGGSNVFLYTDGLTETKNASGEEFGEVRLTDLLKSPSPVARRITEIYDELINFSGGNFQDDLTILLLKRDGP